MIDLWDEDEGPRWERCVEREREFMTPDWDSPPYVCAVCVDPL